ncbi:hypothetical protein V6N13_083420 [Hibiscus sabdariffa]
MQEYNMLSFFKIQSKKWQRSGEIKQTAEDLDEFLNRVRRGAGVSNDDILCFAKLFNDELTLDNISTGLDW